MFRRQFLTGTAVGLATLAAPNLVRSATPQSVIVIGAGAAGLTAAYHLRQAGVRVTLLEASGNWGGRIARARGFADYPIDLGAEWIHDDADVLAKIIGQSGTDLGIKTIDYRPQSYDQWHRNRLRKRNGVRHFYSEVKFRDTTWYGFFERFLLPNVQDALYLNAPVSQVQYDHMGATAILRNGRRIQADKILITVPLSILKSSALRFDPALPKVHVRNISASSFGQGFKVFLKFRERFFPDALVTGPMAGFLADNWDEKLYYDAGFGKVSNDNILALFTVAERDLPRAQLSDRALVASILAELDEIYGGVASQLFQGSLVQNWSHHPHIQGSYSMSMAAGRSSRKLLPPISGRIFFAGEALGAANQATVHGASFSAISAVEEILSA